jgi:phytoene dehydrogenase-like protein
LLLSRRIADAYAPYELRDGSWDDHPETFADCCFDLLDEYAPNFKRAVIDRQVLTPLDLERVFNLTGGNIFQGAMTPVSSSPSVRCPDTRATGRRSAACTCAAPPPTPAAA